VRPLALVVLAGCLGDQRVVLHPIQGNLQLGTDGVRGGELVSSGAIHGWGLEAHVHGQQLERDEPAVPGYVRRNLGFGIDFALRLSLFGIVADDQRLARWFDIGATLGGGGGFIKPSRLTTYAEAWAGAWIEVGLAPGDRYPALVLEVRRAAITDWNDRTVFIIGLAFTRRYADNIDIHD